MLALIRRFTGTRAPGLADRVGALPPFSPRNPSTGSHSRGLGYRTRLDTLSASVRAGPDGRGPTAGVCGAGSAPTPPPRRWGIWPGPSPAERAPQSLGTQLPVRARLPLLPAHLGSKPGADLTAISLQEPAGKEGAASGSEETLVRTRFLPAPMHICCLWSSPGLIS